MLFIHNSTMAKVTALISLLFECVFTNHSSNDAGIKVVDNSVLLYVYVECAIEYSIWLDQICFACCLVMLHNGLSTAGYKVYWLMSFFLIYPLCKNIIILSFEVVCSSFPIAISSIQKQVYGNFYSKKAKVVVYI